MTCRKIKDNWDGWNWKESFLKYWNDEILVAEIASAYDHAPTMSFCIAAPVPDPDPRTIDDELNAARDTL